MTVADRIREKLVSRFNPVALEIIDESHLHAGHAGAPKHDGEGSAESHFRIVITSSEFTGVSRVQRQRLVNDILREELDGPVHALSMRTLTPKEAADHKAQA
ncbi:MAG: BolA family protein [Pseudomonadota bacterium]